MKTHFPQVCWFMFALAALVAGARGENAKASFPPYSIPGSLVRVLPRTLPDREYQLIIGLPADFSQNSDKRYPVVFVTDGYWDFVKIHSIRGSLVYDKTVPDFITVAIGYAGENPDYARLRCRDLSPVTLPEIGPEASGHAAEFLELIEKTIIPLVERDYRADPERRVLAGTSLGGLFALYTMYTKPELFKAYIAATPAVMVGNYWILDHEEAFAKSGRQLNARLYVTVGGREDAWAARGVERMDHRIKSRNHPGLSYAFRNIEDEKHGSVAWESYVRGLRFAFAEDAKR